MRTRHLGFWGRQHAFDLHLNNLRETALIVFCAILDDARKTRTAVSIWMQADL